jgi:hypothetical protein
MWLIFLSVSAALIAGLIWLNDSLEKDDNWYTGYLIMGVSFVAIGIMIWLGSQA